MRIVIDSNVIIAAFAVRGLCHALFEYCLDSHDVVLCETILKEVKKNLERKVRVPSSVAGEIDAYLRVSAYMENPIPLDSNVFSEKSDLQVLGVAAASGCSHIITGDKALPALKKFGGIDIVSPRAFWESSKKKPRRGSNSKKP